LAAEENKYRPAAVNGKKLFCKGRTVFLFLPRRPVIVHQCAEGNPGAAFGVVCRVFPVGKTIHSFASIGHVHLKAKFGAAGGGVEIKSDGKSVPCELPRIIKGGQPIGGHQPEIMTKQKIPVNRDFLFSFLSLITWYTFPYRFESLLPES
jgi:hypothetical protein